MQAKVLAALLAVQLLFAAHYIASKWILDSISAPAWVAIRVVGAALVLLCIAAVSVREWPRSWMLYARLAGLSIFGIVINQVLFIEGLSRTTPAHSALINTSIPVSTLIIAILLRRESGSPRKFIALGLALSGVLVLLSEQGFDLSSSLVRGDLLCLANATSFSLFLVLSRPIMRSFPPAFTTAMLFAMGSLAVGAYGSSELMAMNWSSVSSTVWLIAVLVILGPTVGTYFLNNWTLARVDSSLVALFIYLQFVIAAPLSWAVLGDELSWRLIPAAILVFAGLLLSVSDRQRRAAP
jgi:drug/metabolite transporter (DMT)-like permease